MNRKFIQQGTRVDSRFGAAKVTRIELCRVAGEKEGLQVDKIFVEDKDRCVFDLDNGHWCYGYQITVEEVANA